MGATFPNGIASFRQHRDLLDDVAAADINKIQDEVVALQETLGEALNTIEVIETEIASIDTEIDSLEAENLLDQQRDASLLIKYTSLKDLIAALWEGKNIYAASASTAHKKLRKTPAARPYPPGLVILDKPSKTQDPNAMWNGSGFTVKKSGFYVVHGQLAIEIAKTGPSSNANFGTYEASVTLNGTNWLRSLDRQYPQVDKYWHDVVLNPLLTGWLSAGTRVQLRAAQSSDLDQSIASAHLSIYRVRGM